MIEHNPETGYRQVLCANSFTSLAELSLHRAGKPALNYLIAEGRERVQVCTTALGGMSPHQVARFEKLKAQAETDGDVNSVFLLAECYQYGIGTEEDWAQADFKRLNAEILQIPDD